MKNYARVIAAVLAAMLALSLFAGCSGEQPAQEPDAALEVEKTVSIGDIYSEIESMGMLPAMYQLEDAYIDGYYGISPESVEDKVFAVADDSLLADTVIIVRAVSSEEAEGMKTVFQGINAQRMAELESYNPEQYARVEKALISTSGSYVYYIVTDDNAAVAAVIEEKIS